MRGLGGGQLHRYPHQFSDGQRQREMGIDTLLRDKGFSDEAEAALAAAADSGVPSDDALAAE